MQHLIRETLQQVAREAPAIPFSVLVRRLRARGAAVNEAALLRLLADPTWGARLIDPWTGAHGALRAFLGAERCEAGPWVILQGPEPDPPDPDAPAPARIRRSLLRLGVALDARSPRDVARWVALVEEACRLPRAA